MALGWQMLTKSHVPFKAVLYAESLQSIAAAKSR
jgi:hypothetical protein